MADDLLNDPQPTPAQRWVQAVVDAQSDRVEHLLRMAFLFEADPQRAAKIRSRLYTEIEA